MTEGVARIAGSLASTTSGASNVRLRRRRRAELRFRAYGIVSIGIALLTLLALLGSVAYQGLGAFTRSMVVLEVEIDAERISPQGDASPDALARGDYEGLIKAALRARFPEVTSRNERRALTGLVSAGAAYALRARVLEDPRLIGTTIEITVPLSDEADRYVKGHVSSDVPEADRQLGDREIGWIDSLMAAGAVSRELNTNFLTAGDSREPELAGIGGALVGSLLTMFVTLALCFPLGVAAAVYLEEFAPKSRWTDIVEININNLAAVPSVIFGLLGLAVFLGFMNLPRSSPMVGGLVLAIRTLPIIIIAARAALAAVPPSIREGALGIGASPVQVVAHHVIPQAMPGILTGAILGMAQALGETAPLLMVGMVAFVVDIPTGIDAPATVLPVQIFLWADAPERAFVEKTAGAIIILLAFLISLNATAVLLRHRYEKRL